MSSLDAALAYAREHRDAHLAQYKELLAIPSISTQTEHVPDIQRNAEWMAAELKRIGMIGTEIMPTPGHPMVYAESPEVAGKPTLLVYGHYDVQPADPLQEWDSDPFGAEVRGDYIYARGASDMKGQLFAQLKAVEALVKNGGCPVNLKFLFEGEEEIGSPNLAPFIDAHKDLLDCDVVLNCDAGIHAKDVPAITYALRGLAYFELEVQSAASDLHSGLFGGSIRNPIHVLSDLIAGMHDTDGRVTLPGFYDKVRELDDAEREVLKKVPYSDAEWLDTTGASALHGEKGYTTTERVGARPTLEVNGIWGGYIEEGAKTVLPARATAKISARLVADQAPGEIRGQLEAYLEARTPEGVAWKLDEHSQGPGSIMDRGSVYMQAARQALEAVFGAPPLFIRQGGSVPVVGMMQEKLGVDSVMLGFGLPGDGIHGPNEKQYLPNFFRGIETHIRFLAGL